MHRLVELAKSLREVVVERVYGKSHGIYGKYGHDCAFERVHIREGFGGAFSLRERVVLSRWQGGGC